MKKSDLYKDPYYNLAVAIIEIACDDYVEMFFKQFTAPESKRLADGRMTKNYRIEAKYFYESAKRFFESDLQNNFLLFTEMSGVDIMKELNKRILKRVIDDLREVKAYCESHGDECTKCIFYDNGCKLDKEPFQYELPNK